MTKVSLDAIKAKLREAQSKGNREEGSKRSTGDNASYAFWNIPVNSSATIRFLPDNDPDNVFFWRERQTIKLAFEGVVGGDYPTSKKVEVTVPCIDMFGMTCPIIAHTRPWWKDPAKEDLARQYYKKRSYIFQGFVVQSPFTEESVPENPIRRFTLNKSIYQIVEKSLMDPEMEDAPTDYVNGVDFKISKTQQGEYANYSTSNWARKSRSLTENELVAIEQHGLYTLKDYLGRVPDTDEVEAIKAMFFDSLDGKPFDMDSYGKYYRPYGTRGGDDNDSSEVTQAARSAMSRSTPAAPAAAPAAAATEDEAPRQAAAAPASTGGASAHEILERIKNRAR